MKSPSIAALRILRSLNNLPRRNPCHHHIRQNLSTSSTRHQSSQNTLPQEPLIPAPKPNSGPLLSRLPNRALPTVSTGLSSSAKLWLKTLPFFIFLIAASSLSIFNYQKSTSSTVSSILYALRTSPVARELLGDEIYFASRVPWISGELNQLHGIIDVGFWVKGNKEQGLVRFVSLRERRDGFFVTKEWSLKMEDGRVVHLLKKGQDPLVKQVEGLEEL